MKCLYGILTKCSGVIGVWELVCYVCENHNTLSNVLLITEYYSKCRKSNHISLQETSVQMYMLRTMLRGLLTHLLGVWEVWEGREHGTYKQKEGIGLGFSFDAAPS